MEKLVKIVGVVVLGVVTLTGISALTAFPIKWLWNYFMGNFDHFRTGFYSLDFWHAWSLSVLSGLLFSRNHSGNLLSKKNA